jgi:hypothetical protein
LQQAPKLLLRRFGVAARLRRQHRERPIGPHQ